LVKRREKRGTNLNKKQEGERNKESRGGKKHDFRLGGTAFSLEQTWEELKEDGGEEKGRWSHKRRDVR